MAKTEVRRGRGRLPPLVRVPRSGAVPQSSSQQRLWFLSQLDTGGAAYNVPYFSRLKGRLDVAALERALNVLVQRHEPLRTTYAEVDGQPVQCIAPEGVLALEVEDLSSWPEAEREPGLRARALEESRRPFDLRRGPVVRARLLRLREDEHVLLLTLHHILCDGWSLGVLERELGALYSAFVEGREPGLPALPVAYADHAAWQHDWLQGDAWHPQRDWWTELLKGAPPLLSLPTDRPRPAVQTFRGALRVVPLPSELTGALRALAKQEGVTPFMLLLAGYQALLARYSGQSDVVVGTPISGRNHREVEPLIGFFANTLALRVDASGDLRFRELLGRVRQVCLGAYAHPDVPFERLVDALRRERDLSRTPLFQASFVLQGSPFTSVRMTGLQVEELFVDPGVSKFDLTLFVRDSGEELVGLWEYSTDLFDEGTVARMAAHYTRLLEGVVADPRRRLSELPLLSEAERRELLVDWNGTRVDPPRDASLPALFEEQVALRPDAVAVEFEGACLTYAQLDRRANQLAHHLRGLGVGVGTRVGLCAGRSLEGVVATLAILKAGGAYVPLDPAYPRERLAFMVEDTGVPVLLVQPEWEARVPSGTAKVVVLEPSGHAFAGERSDSPGVRVPPESLAYVMFTSGSTGRPKGVCVPHRAVVRLVKGSDFVEWGPDEVYLQLAPSSFDASTLELWGALLHGAKLVIFPAHTPTLEELGQALVRHGITTLWLTAALFEQMMATQPKALARVRQVLAGGDVLSPARVRERLESGVLVNGYGPTENTTFSTCYRMTAPEQVGASVSIGKPIANSQAYVLDARMEPVPVGVAGELYVGGDGLAWGYLHQPGLTAERFLPNPFSEEPGARLYRTGDLARWLPDGRLEFLGRRDTQVKVRGFRIEVGEVESALLQHPGVREAVVVARDDGATGKHLVAYVTPRTPLPPGEGWGEGLPTVESLRNHLRQTLPEYMVPSAYVVLRALPLTPNGKVDRKALPEPGTRGERDDYVPPRTAMEELLADIWAPLLGRERIGAHDHFFELGGHSLLATRLSSRLRESLQVEVPVRMLFDAPTVAELAQRIESLLAGTSGPSLPPLAPVARTGALPQSFAQQRLWFITQLDGSGFSYNVPFALRLHGPLDAAVLERGLRVILQRHESLRTTFAEVDGKPIQRIAAELSFALSVEDLTSLPETRREHAMRQRVEEEARRPFDLRRGPLVRAVLLRLASHEHVLLYVIHHIVFDGWSVGVLQRELAAFYTAFLRGEGPVLPSLPVQYADHAAWQRGWLQGEALDAQLAWWKRQLAGAPTVLDLPTDRPRPPVQSFRGALLPVPLPPGLGQAVRDLSRREGVTLFMTLLAGFHALLARHSGQEDLVVGSPISGRNHREVEDLIGFFVNTLALRLDASGDVSFRELLSRTRESCLGAYAHQDIPFEHLVDALQPVRDLSRSPLFQVMFVMPGLPPPLELPGVTAEDVAFEPGVAKFDLTLFVNETAGGLVSLWEYNTDLFDEATVARMASRYLRLLEGAVTRPERRLSELPLLTEAERRRVLVEFSHREDPGYVPGLIHRWVEAQVARTPDAVAVTDGTASLTYARLDARANQLAHHLIALGVRPNGTVGLCLERSSLDMPVAVLATLKAGAAFLPLDPTYPAERLALMLEDTHAPVVLAHASLVSAVPSGTPARILRLEDLSAELEARPIRSPEVDVSPETHCYFVYTSGSTGRPKGIVMSHRAVGNMLAWLLKRTVDPGATTLQFASLNFDVSFQEMFGTWCLGGRVLLMTAPLRQDPAAMLRYMVRHRVGRLYLPFVALQAVCDAALTEAELPPLNEVITAGEQLQVTPALTAFFERLPGCVLENQYGPSEAHVVTAWRASGGPRTWPRLPPVGVPITNVRLYVLDPRGEPCPMGVPGEVHVGGASLAHGYYGRPELTADRFLPAVIPGGTGERLYRTGDKARWLADGNLEFLGRLDGQVKLRGFRIELGEVEVALRALPGVRDAVAIVREDIPGDRRLVAYVVPISPLPPGEGRGEGSTHPELDLGAVRAALKDRLPDYMLPSAVVRLDALPLAPTGKVDRKALPPPKADGAREGYIAPRTALEQVVANLWAPLLGLKRVGAHDHFFELGGHSLLATQVVSRLREALQVELPVRVLFEAPTVAALAQRLESERGGQGLRAPPLLPLPSEGELHQSFAQQRLWFLAQLDPSGFSYNMPFATRLRGALDVAALERSLDALVARHESLRTTFAEVKGHPVQRIVPALKVDLPVESLEALPEPERARAMKQRVEEEAVRPFDLEHGPLLRARLLRLSRDEHVLVFCVHHIVFDGWSIGVMEQELSALYAAFSRAAPPELPALPVRYSDFARWQRDWLRGEVVEAELGYWKQQLAGAPPVLELPTDKPRPAMQSLHGVHLPVRLPPELSGAVRELARKEGVTLFMTLLAGFQALLARYSGQEDVVVGSPISGRNHRELEGLLGFFVNTLPLRVEAAGDVSFRELLARVRRACLGAYAHQDIPFEHLVDALQPVRDLSRSPLFQVMFVLPSTTPGLSLPGVVSEEVAFEPGMAKFDLTLFVRETAGGLLSTWEYNTDLFEAATVARMASHYIRLLQAAVANPEQRLAALPLLGEEERRRVLVEWNDSAASFPGAWGVHALFEAQAARTPEAIAVSFGDARLTYGELNQRADRLARRLWAHGVGADVPVALCVRRSFDLVVGILGILKAGGAYVPLDPAYPPERLALMLEASRAPVALTQPELVQTLPPSGATRLLVEEEPGPVARDLEPLAPTAGPESLAYVIYTSGSTGVPKGVAMHHRPLVNLVHWQLQRSAVPGGRTLQFSALSFDVCFQEVLPTLAGGGELVLVTEEVRRDGSALLRLLDERAVERIFLPFVALQHLAEVAEQEGRVPRHLREINVAGEQLRLTPALRKLMKRLDGCVLDNHYGPSETHAATAFVLRGDPDTWMDLPPIGTPISNARVHLLDANLSLVPVGVPGELYIGGAGVARGYLHRPELTLERFLPDPFSPEPGARLYRSGDFGRYLPDGNIEFLGRRDAQVKVRGYRIELAEVEAVLAKHPEVKDCVVEARDGGAGNKRLVAYVVPRKQVAASLSSELRAFLKQRLPEHMVPTVFLSLDVFPLTPSGKVARKALPTPEVTRQDESRTVVPPRTTQELRLVRVWEEVLGVQPVGVRDNFFELGGHSLMAVRLLSRIRECTGQSLSVAALFQNATVEHLASLLNRESGPWSPLVELRGGTARRPFFCVHPVGGNVLCYVELARALGSDQPFYALQSRGLDGREEPLRTVPEMAALYLSAARTVQPHGPYLLGGWSMGGTLALEMARQLQEQGERVEVLALIDTYARPAPGVEQASASDTEAARLTALFYKDLLRAAGHALPASDEALSQMEPEAMSQFLEEASRSAVAGGGLEALEALRRVFDTNLRAAWSYEPAPYTGPLTSFEASEETRVHGWEHVASALEVHKVPGDHYSLLRGEQVLELAARLRACLDRAHAAGTERVSSA